MIDEKDEEEEENESTVQQETYLIDMENLRKNAEKQYLRTRKLTMEKEQTRQNNLRLENLYNQDIVPKWDGPRRGAMVTEKILNSPEELSYNSSEASDGKLSSSKDSEPSIINYQTTLHYRKYVKLEGLEKYTNILKLYAKCRNLKKISGLNKNTELVELDLRRNQIKSIENIDHLWKLKKLNLSNNLIKQVDGVRELENLTEFDLSGNLIKYVRDCSALLTLPCLTKLELKCNLLEERDSVILPFLSKLDGLKQLSLKGNPFVNYIANYRESVIVEMPALERLDDKIAYRHNISLTNWA